MINNRIGVESRNCCRNIWSVRILILEFYVFAPCIVIQSYNVNKNCIFCLYYMNDIRRRSCLTRNLISFSSFVATILIGLYV